MKTSIGDTNRLEAVFASSPENERISRVTAAAFAAVLNPTVEELSDFKTAVSEAVTNAIIHASREQMLGATLYLVGREAATGELIPDANSCTMCKRMIINAGIEKVVIRRDMDTYDIIDVQQWVDHDELLAGETGY